jgi:hypothetical protein
LNEYLVICICSSGIAVWHLLVLLEYLVAALVSCDAVEESTASQLRGRTVHHTQFASYQYLLINYSLICWRGLQAGIPTFLMRMMLAEDNPLNTRVDATPLM